MEDTIFVIHGHSKYSNMRYSFLSFIILLSIQLSAQIPGMFNEMEPLDNGDIIFRTDQDTYTRITPSGDIVWQQDIPTSNVCKKCVSTDVNITFTCLEDNEFITMTFDPLITGDVEAKW